MCTIPQNPQHSHSAKDNAKKNGTLKNFSHTTLRAQNPTLGERFKKNTQAGLRQNIKHETRRQSVLTAALAVSHGINAAARQHAAPSSAEGVAIAGGRQYFYYKKILARREGTGTGPRTTPTVSSFTYLPVTSV